ncbi:putative glycosyltransferase [Vibrio chagasii]|nr:putative glycosyltransferase [Vibrio chagasii]CAH7167773.1 putative glycosyltransferase [Vibrio chagasii]CAH7358797.1 putative glycosyltransferase [Vibrio chagasii]
MKKLVKNFISALVKLNNIDNIISAKLKIQDLNRTQTGKITSEQNVCDSDVVVSVTTYSKRIHDIHLVIESIGRQTVLPNRVVLWLDENEFESIEALPIRIKNLISRGLEVKFCENLRSYKKLVPSLKFFPNSNIVTVDDDIIYPDDMIEILISEHLKYPGTIIGHRAHLITLDDHNNPKKYNDWIKNVSEGVRGDKVFITTGGGTFFPKQILNDEVLNQEVFMKYCPTADDIWVRIMTKLSGVQCKRVDDTRSFKDRFYILEESQDIGLFNTVNNRSNDEQFRALLKYYNINKNWQD